MNVLKSLAVKAYLFFNGKGYVSTVTKGNITLDISNYLVREDDEARLQEVTEKAFKEYCKENGIQAIIL